jgi:hypothetical protein
MPAFTVEGRRLPGVKAGANLSANRYRFVKFDATADQVIAITAATDQPAGLQLDKPDALGKPIDVAIDGIEMAEVGAAVAYGALLQSDNVGRAITAVSTGYVCARALAAAGGAGERIPVELNCVNPWLKA